jgi:hypothetical protein
MPSDYQGPFSGQENELHRSELPESTTVAMTSQQRKIDPTGMMGNAFAYLGAILVVIGVLTASLLGYLESGRFGFYFAILAGAWGTGLLFLLAGLVILLFFRNVRSAVVAEHFLSALLNQDFQSALQYLDPWIMTGQNELDTKTRFTQLARTYEEHGNISDYALRGFSLNLKRARYTIKIWRGTRSYRVQLFLVKQGDTWQIIGFDRL